MDLTIEFIWFFSKVTDGSSLIEHSITFDGASIKLSLIAGFDFVINGRVCCKMVMYTLNISPLTVSSLSVLFYKLAIL